MPRKKQRFDAYEREDLGDAQVRTYISPSGQTACTVTTIGNAGAVLVKKGRVIERSDTIKSTADISPINRT